MRLGVIRNALLVLVVAKLILADVIRVFKLIHFKFQRLNIQLLPIELLKNLQHFKVEAWHDYLNAYLLRVIKLQLEYLLLVKVEVFSAVNKTCKLKGLKLF